MIVVDASAVLESLLRMPAAGRIDERLFDENETLHAPHLLDLEIAQVLRRYARTRQVPAERCRAALEDLAELPLTRYSHQVLLPRIWTLRDTLTAYDAAYVALAEALNAPLLTRDRALAAAQGHQALIEVV